MSPSSLEQTASLPGKQLFSLGRQATIQSTQAGFQIVFKPNVESFYETYMRTGSISSKHVKAKSLFLCKISSTDVHNV